MRTKKLFAGVLAGAMVVGCMVVPASALEPVDFTDSFTLTLNSGEDNMIQFYMSDFYVDDTSVVDSVTFTYSGDLSSQGWTGGGGSVGFGDGYGNWYQEDFEITADTETVTIDFDVDTMSYGDIIQIGLWWASGDSIDVTDFTVNYTTGTVTTHDSSLTYDITEDDIANYDSYTVTLVNVDGEKATVTDNTYCTTVDSETGEVTGYYIEIDVTDIPAAQRVSIDSVVFE